MCDIGGYGNYLCWLFLCHRPKPAGHFALSHDAAQTPIQKERVSCAFILGLVLALLGLAVCLLATMLGVVFSMAGTQLTRPLLIRRRLPSALFGAGFRGNVYSVVRII